MFTWICPQCGREVPPSQAECPHCASGGAAETTTARPAAPSRPTATPTHRLPAWLLTVMFAGGFALAGLAAYWGYRHWRPQPQAAAPPTKLEAPPVARAAAPSKPHPLARYIEITGLRLSEDARQKASIQFLVVNHSTADLSGLAANVRLVAVSEKGERTPVGTFSFRLASLGPNESRELQAPLTTNLRVYELPDWQFLRAEFELTSPMP